MSSYKKSLIFCTLLFIFSGCSTKDINLEEKELKKSNFKKIETKYFDLENQYIIFALEAENQRLFYDAKEAYLKLFEKTNNYEYFVKYLSIATQLKEYAAVKEKVLKYSIKNIEEEETILRIYTFSLFKLQEKEESILNAIKLVSLYKNSVNYELLGSIYFEDKQYIKAYESFNNAFTLNDSSNTLLTLTNIQFYSLSQKNEAIKRLEDYIQINEYNFNLSIQLLTFYEELKAKDKILLFLKNMFYYYKQSDNQLLLNKTKALFVKYIINDDVQVAIDFW